jgi:hypothetical protein
MLNLIWVFPTEIMPIRFNLLAWKLRKSYCKLSHILSQTGNINQTIITNPNYYMIDAVS